jgi:LysM repeat protein
MQKKDVIIISSLVNAGLLIILLISALTNKESYLLASSAKIAGSILERDKEGMTNFEDLKLEKVKEVKEEIKEVLKTDIKKEEEEIIHKLPKVPIEEIREKEVMNEKMEVVVKKGDSLERIAKRYNTTVDEIVKINNLPNSFLRIGQVLFLNKKPGVKRKVKVESNKFYVVKPGDNPWTISMKHNMKVKDLLRLNNLDDRKAKRLRPGDKLRIR